MKYRTKGSEVVATRLTGLERRLLEAMAQAEDLSVSSLLHDMVTEGVKEGLERHLVSLPPGQDPQPFCQMRPSQ